MSLNDVTKVAWEVVEVYRGWFDQLYRKIRPYRVHLTSANISMFIVTVIAMMVGFVIFFRKRKARMEWDKARRASLAAKQDEEWLKARKRARLAKKAKEAAEIKDPYMAKVRSPPNCPFKHIFGDFMDQPGDGEKDEGDDGGREIMDKLREQIHKSIEEERKKKGEVLDSDDDDVLISSDSITNIRERGAGDGYVDDGAKGNGRFGKDGQDPLEFAMHIPAELKKIQNKVTTREMEKQLSEDQKAEEARTRRRQLEQIFQLMQDQKEKFGPQSTEEMEEQMRMYSL